MLWFILEVYIESCFSKEKAFLSTKLEEEEMAMYLQDLFEARPSVSVNITCWHLETRTVTNTYTDANGNVQTNVQTITERVNTHFESAEFEFKSWRDISDRNALPRINGVTRLTLSKEFVLYDQQTTDALEALKNEMTEKNLGRDAFIDCDVIETLPNFKEYLLVKDPRTGIPCWMNLCCFWFCTLIWCTWPFRMLLNNRTESKKYNYRKEISIAENAFYTNFSPNGPAVLNPQIPVIQRPPAHQMDFVDFKPTPSSGYGIDNYGQDGIPMQGIH